MTEDSLPPPQSGTHYRQVDNVKSNTHALLTEFLTNTLIDKTTE